MTVFAHTADEAASITSGLERWAPVDALAIQPPTQSNFAALYGEIDSHYSEGLRYSVDSLWSSDPAITFPGLARMVQEAPSAGSNALGFIYPARSEVMKRLPEGAFSMMAQAYGLVCGVWTDPAEDALNLLWMRAGVDAVAEATLGHCVGEADLVRPGWAAGCYGEEARLWIEELRAAYDPKGVFAGRVVRDGAAETPLALAVGVEMAEDATLSL